MKIKVPRKLLIALLLSAALKGYSQALPVTLSPSCGEMEVRDIDMGMCMPLATEGMPMRMLMLRFNSFLLQTVEEGPRGRKALSLPDMFMLDAGSSFGNRHYVNLDLMGTFERWTFPRDGTPELLQIGEENSDHQPFLDAQHPHSTPVMGLTLSDTYSLGHGKTGHGKDHAKIWFAPRGQSTDGPIAFMHRATGIVNPDAPLGHHIGQDVGHITSTVVGASLNVQSTTLELSTFNGTEPEPTQIDLPLGPLNSFAGRLTYVFTPQTFAMASAAFVQDPEPHDSESDHVWRYSTSLYEETPFQNGWTLQNVLIWGLINRYDHAAALNSLGEEFALQKGNKTIWGRLEYLQRTPAELRIESSSPNDPRWVTALTLGYTRKIARLDFGALSIGASVTKDLLPPAYRPAYAGDPLALRVSVNVSGMKMWDY